MKAFGQGSPEDILDQALEELLAGSALEDIELRYPGVRSSDLAALLGTARAVQQGPHPTLPQSSLSAMVARAQAYAGTVAPGDNVPDKTATVSAPAARVSAASLSSAAPPGKRPVSGPVQGAPSWVERLRAWVRPAAPILRSSTIIAVLLLAVGGLLIFARNAYTPPVIAVPTFTSVGFTVDAPITAISANHWTVGGVLVEIDRDTQIVGTPAIGASAHVEGDLIAGSRRIARSITVHTAVSAVTPTESMPVIITPAWTATPVPVSAPIGEITPVEHTPVPQIASATPTEIAASIAPTLSPTGRAGAAAAPSRTPELTATRTRVPATVTRHPTASNTPTSTPVFTHTPEPTRTITHTPTPEPSLTEQPSPTELATQTPEPIIWPTETATAQATPQPEPSDTPEPEPSDTPAPAATHTPAPPPVFTPTYEPTGEPDETHTVVPVRTGTPPPPSPTREGTRTPDPHETETVRTAP